MAEIKQERQQEQISTSMKQCIENCLDCYSICTQTLTYCQSKGGKHADPEHLRLLQDCIEICQLSADFMLRRSPLHTRTCGVCAEICERCAVSCETMPEDPWMKACAESCRRCAQSCQQMSARRPS